MKKLLAVGLLVALVPAANAATSPEARVKHHGSLRSMAKVSADSAKAIALAQVPNGKVQARELEKENGKLVYSFDLKVPGKSGVEEVQVDAKNGQVVSTKHESARTERRERAKEEHKAATSKKAMTGKSTP